MAVRDALSRAASLRNAGKPDEGLVAAEAALASAQALGCKKS
jgi:hypothetical protein